MLPLLLHFGVYWALVLGFCVIGCLVCFGVEGIGFGRGCVLGSGGSGGSGNRVFW